MTPQTVSLEIAKQLKEAGWIEGYYVQYLTDEAGVEHRIYTIGGTVVGNIHENQDLLLSNTKQQ